MSEEVDGIILENLTNRMDEVENNLNQYLDILYNISQTVEDTESEVKYISMKLLPELKLRLLTGLMAVYFIGILILVAVTLILIHIF